MLPAFISGRLLTAAQSLLRHGLLERGGGLESKDVLSELLPCLRPCSMCPLHRTITDLPVDSLKALVGCMSNLNRLQQLHTRGVF